jgi:hypothetical protein
VLQAVAAAAAGGLGVQPARELTVRSKLSSLSYSAAVSQHLLAADYQVGRREGLVQPCWGHGEA